MWKGASIIQAEVRVLSGGSLLVWTCTVAHDLAPSPRDLYRRAEFSHRFGQHTMPTSDFMLWACLWVRHDRLDLLCRFMFFLRSQMYYCEDASWIPKAKIVPILGPWTDSCAGCRLLLGEKYFPSRLVYLWRSSVA